MTETDQDWHIEITDNCTILCNGRVRTEVPGVVKFSQDGDITTLVLQNVPIKSEERIRTENGWSISPAYFSAKHDYDYDAD